MPVLEIRIQLTLTTRTFDSVESVRHIIIMLAQYVPEIILVIDLHIKPSH